MQKEVYIKRWYDYIPHSVVILFFFILLVSFMSHILPAGSYERIEVDGRMQVVAGSYAQSDSNPAGLLDIFLSIPLGFKLAVEIIFVVFAGGIMFGLLEKTKTIENMVGQILFTIGLKRRYAIVIVTSILFWLLGTTVGYETNIALVPLAAVLSLAIGGDLILAAGMSVGAMTVGFGLSPINPFTVGTGHRIAEIDLFSGWELRLALCIIGLLVISWYNLRYLKKISNDPSKSLGMHLNTEGLTLVKPIESYKMTWRNWLCLLIFITGMSVSIYGIFNWSWLFNELSAVFIMVGVFGAIVSGLNMNQISESVLEGVAFVAPGAFMVGYASAIRVIMESSQIADTISHGLSLALQELPIYLSAVSMCLSQCVLNLFIPSGSGQALATLPVMIPLGQVLGLSPQVSILAFQIGDGVTNLFNPSLGGLIAMLGMCRVPFDRWLRFILPLTLIILAFALAGLILAVAIGYQ